MVILRFEKDQCFIRGNRDEAKYTDDDDDRDTHEIDAESVSAFGIRFIWRGECKGSCLDHM